MNSHYSSEFKGIFDDNVSYLEFERVVYFLVVPLDDEVGENRGIFLLLSVFY